MTDQTASAVPAAPPQKDGAARAPSRGRGRPRTSQQTQLTKTDVIARGLAHAERTALQDITITALARELQVTPSLIHYLIPGRDGLITGVMNAFYEKLCASWPEPRGTWREHMSAMARHLRDFYTRFRGVVLYTATHNRYRVVQTVESDETDYGLVFLDLLFRGAMTMKLDPANTVVFSEVFIDFVSSQARSTITTRLPSAHQGYLRGVFEGLDQSRYVGIAYAGDEIFATDSARLFEEGLTMLLDAFEMRRAKLI